MLSKPVFPLPHAAARHLRGGAYLKSSQRVPDIEQERFFQRIKRHAQGLEHTANKVHLPDMVLGDRSAGNRAPHVPVMSHAWPGTYGSEAMPRPYGRSPALP